MTDKEAMKLALFALDIVKTHYTQSRHINEAITALKERLADPMRDVQRLGQEIEQEPVAWLVEFENGEQELHFDKQSVGETQNPLYTHPPQRTEQEPVEYWNVTEGWATVGQEGASDQVYRFPKWPHKYQWVTGRGYVVWRDVFEGNMKCSLDEAITAHTQAVFVFEDDASNYCNFKNTHPPQRTWVGLTDEDDIDWEEGGNLTDLVKAIEAKLKEKNT